VTPLEAPPAPQLGVPAAGVAAGGDLDDGGDDSSLSHSTDLSEERGCTTACTRSRSVGDKSWSSRDLLPRFSKR
jgi:hypothetical protein